MNEVNPTTIYAFFVSVAVNAGPLLLELGFASTSLRFSISDFCSEKCASSYVCAGRFGSFTGIAVQEGLNLSFNLMHLEVVHCSVEAAFPHAAVTVVLPVHFLYLYH